MTLSAPNRLQQQELLNVQNIHDPNTECIKEMTGGLYTSSDCRCSHRGGKQYPEQQKTHVCPGPSHDAQQRVCLWTGGCPAQCPYPEQLQGDSYWDGTSGRGQSTAGWGPPRFSPASRENAGNHQVEGRPRGQQAISKLQILEACEVPDASAKQTPQDGIWCGSFEWNTRHVYPEHSWVVVLITHSWLCPCSRQRSGTVKTWDVKGSSPRPQLANYSSSFPTCGRGHASFLYAFLCPFHSFAAQGHPCAFSSLPFRSLFFLFILINNLLSE